MVTHISTDDIVIVYPDRGSYARFIRAAKQAMDKNVGEIIVLVLLQFARSDNFMAKFFRVVRLGSIMFDRCATRAATNKEHFRVFLQARLDAIAAGIPSYTRRLVYSAKTLTGLDETLKLMMTLQLYCQPR